ncbi:MAG: hypothetical protein JSW71_11685 [Gemmatimonadota bacterium]|nr:MAG: hypothetical protein JSW71_11685 [Gemmatimonadota bacterium]
MSRSAMQLACIVLLLCAVHSFTVRTMVAQDSNGLGAGARIRLWSDLVPGRYMSGRLVDLTQDSISLIPTGDTTMVLPLEAVGRLETNIGRDPAALAATIALSAAAGAVFLPALSNDPPICDLGYEDSEECRTETPDILIGAGAGVIGGILLSRWTAPQRWVGIQMDLLLRDGTVRFQRGLALSVAVRF